MRRAVQLCLAILLLASAPVEAQPQPAQRVIVERFRGPRGSAMRRALVRDLEDNGVFVIDESEVRDASRRLGIGRRPTDAEYVDPATFRDDADADGGAVAVAAAAPAAPPAAPLSD